jgi:Sulfotransferase family
MDREQVGGKQPRQRTRVRPVFVVTPARCGSTLLRYLLDSHPEITSPPELNLSGLLVHLVEVWTNMNATITAEHGDPAPPGGNDAGPELQILSPEVRKRARKAVDEIMVTAANAAGASVYCDKSLTTVDHLAVVSQCYPNAALIFLYRYPLDMIASGLEASKWGFGAFGFAPFVAANPGNLVAALGNYWIDRVSKMVAFEESCDLAHARLYYELLCDDPTRTMEQLFGFLGVRSDQTVIERVFGADHGVGPGDYKIDFTGSVGVESIGRGSTLPEHLAEQQVDRINELLAGLDYPALDAGRRGDLAALLGLKRTGEPTPDDAAEIAAAIMRRLQEGPTRVLGEAHREALPISIVIRSARGESSVVLIDEHGGASIADDEDSNGSTHRVRCIGDVLLRIADGQTTFAGAVQDNLIRVELGNEANDARPQRPDRTLRALAALIRPEG